MTREDHARFCEIAAFVLPALGWLLAASVGGPAPQVALTLTGPSLQGGLGASSDREGFYRFPAVLRLR